MTPTLNLFVLLMLAAIAGMFPNAAASASDWTTLLPEASVPGTDL